MENEQDSGWGLPAGFVTRLLALIIDLLILTVVVSTITVVAQFVGRSLGVSEQFLKLIALGTTAVGAVFIFLYFVLLTIMGGQTVGKRIMGVRIVRLDGSRVKWWPAVRRLIGLVLSIPLFWGFLLCLVDNRRQDFADKLAGTVVIYYRVPDGQIGAFERYLKAVQLRRLAKLEALRASEQA